MGKNKLVIVESPTKARTIAGILGKEYTLLASMGHIRDLPQNSIGIDFKNNFSPKYTVSKPKIIDALNKAAKNVDEIYLATDPDREGEAIAWHLKEILQKKTKVNFHRVEFHEITKKAIQKAFSEPRDIDQDLVNSQQARRILDRLVGYQISPLLWSRIKRNISAGRVQSVALRIICEREREIQNFIPIEYWNFSADFLWKNEKDKKYTAKLMRVNNAKAEISDKDTAEKISEAINKSEKCFIENVKQEIVTKKASPPFITSTLQQTAGTNLRFSASRTMQVAQQLYEGINFNDNQTSGLITYMRTDSFTLSQEAINNCRNYISDKFGAKFLPAKPNYFKNKSTAQEAHEAIRPTNVSTHPDEVKDHLSREQYNLYKLIWNRFVACQMAPAQVSRTTVDTTIAGNNNDSYLFRTISSVTIFPGYTKVLKSADKANDASGPEFLTKIQEKDPSKLSELNKEQKFTEPPPRYTEPSLIRELEANGIGRPSTYAAIINTILKRKYVNKEKGKLNPFELGFKVNDYLVEFLESLFNIGFTAEMENKLDKIELGKEHWTKMLEEFYEQLSQWVDTAKYKEAPPKDKISNLLSLTDNIKDWEIPPQKSPSFRNDKSFANSLKTQFSKKEKLSKKQWDSLLKLAIKYSTQIPNFEESVQKFGFHEDVLAAKEEIKKQDELNAERQQQYNVITSQVKNALNNFDLSLTEKFTFAESPRFNEKTFLDSLFQRAKEEKPFTIKQKKVLCRILINNKDLINNFNELTKILDMSENDISEITNAGDKSNQNAAEIEELINKLNDFNKWAEPQKKGKRTYDDKSFFESLKKQYENKKQLSSKQVYALKKIATKYFEKE